jgi:hypothetical protein
MKSSIASMLGAPQLHLPRVEPGAEFPELRCSKTHGVWLTSVDDLGCVALESELFTINYVVPIQTAPEDPID